MLVLARKKDETIVIDGEIFITVLESRNGQVRLGIDAPKHRQVYRKELWVEVQESNRSAVANRDAAEALSRFLGLDPSTDRESAS